MLLAA